jgi:hypothetical protein
MFAVGWLKNFMSISQKNKRFVSCAAIILAITAIFIVSLVTFINQATQAQQDQLINSNDPSIVVQTFLHALGKSNFELAKKMVIPEQYLIINKWATESNHRSFECLYSSNNGNGFLDVLNQTPESGGSSYELTEDNKAIADAIFGCTLTNSSIEITGVVLVRNDSIWKITHWNQICESSADAEDDAPPICYEFDK